MQLLTDWTMRGREDIFFQRGKRDNTLLRSAEWIKITIFAFGVRPKKSKLQMSKHLTREQRYAIFAMMQKPYTQKDIAEAIGVSRSTISRELKRNCDLRSGKYVMDLAQRKADERKKTRGIVNDLLLR